jgi:hypothetical protein
VQRVCQYLRERFRFYRLFEDLDAILDGGSCYDAWNRLLAEPRGVA